MLTATGRETKFCRDVCMLGTIGRDFPLTQTNGETQDSHLIQVDRVANRLVSMECNISWNLEPCKPIFRWPLNIPFFGQVNRPC